MLRVTGSASAADALVWLASSRAAVPSVREVSETQYGSWNAAFLFTAERAFEFKPDELRDASPSAFGAQEQASGHVRTGRKLRVVLAEDNVGDVVMVREALTHNSVDAEIVRYKDGEEMFQYIDDLDAGKIPCPDLVLLDLNLPRQSGHAILARLRKSKVCRHVPVIIVTSSKAESDREETSRLGASEYFVKPIDLDEFMKLGAIVVEVLRRAGNA